MLPARTLFIPEPRFQPQAIAIAWSTDPYALQAHMSRCREARSPWFSMRCLAEDVRGFLAPRSFTTLVLLAIVGRVISLAV